MSNNGRISLIFLLNLVLYFIVGEVNFLLGSWSLQVHLDALMIVFLGLYLSHSSSLGFTALLGLLADSLHPGPMGMYLAGYLFLWLYFVWFQRRIRRQNQSHVRIVAASAQAIWIFILALLLGGQQWQEGVYWNRILNELLLSTAFVYVLAWPWCRLQKKFLYNLGWDLESQMSHR